MTNFFTNKMILTTFHTIDGFSSLNTVPALDMSATFFFFSMGTYLYLLSRREHFAHLVQENVVCVYMRWFGLMYALVYSLMCEYIVQFVRPYWCVCDVITRALYCYYYIFCIFHFRSFYKTASQSNSIRNQSISTGTANCFSRNYCK